MGYSSPRRISSLWFGGDSRYDATYRRDRTTSATGIQQNPRLLCVWQLVWISLALVLLLPVEVQAQAQPPANFNPDLDYGWLATGVLDTGRVPTCQYCVNADGSFEIAANEVNGADWNRTVALYRCNGVENNEIWAYDNSTSSFVYSNRTLCLDAVAWDTLSVLTLRICNSSVFTQKWTWEGNLIRSNLTDDEGNGLYLWGDPPDKGQNPSSTVYTYPLILYRTRYNSYPVSPPNNGIKYVSNFTFLSNKDFVDASTDRFTLEGLLQIGHSSENEIRNGGFERTTIQAGANIQSSNYIQMVPDYLSLCGWVIDYGPIDYVGGLLPFPENSTASVHLNTFTNTAHYGAINQTIPIEVGKDYFLSFYFTGFPPVNVVPDRPICNSSYTEALLQVQVTNVTPMDDPMGQFPVSSDGVLRKNFSMSVVDLDAQDLNWTLQMLPFKANSNVTTISFSSLNFNTSCGPMIATVELIEATGPSGISKTVAVTVGVVVGLLGLIALLGIGYGIFIYRAREDYSGLYRTEYARWYSIKELKVATKNFSTVIGEGGFGTVYKADFPNGTVGAVKVEKSRGPNSSKILASDEIALLLRVHHRNLVNLIGFCIHRGRHMLVFEYLPNRSLYTRLHAPRLPALEEEGKESVELKQLSYPVLTWKQRMKIATDVAWGLEYLHHEADPPIVHRDVKSQNILLTTTDAAKLADFGLSKAAPADATSFQSIETMVRGSLGYMDPQYLLTGVFSPKSDVYSFGVVLLELISGHPAIYNGNSLAYWAAPFMTCKETGESSYHELVDKQLNGEYDANELELLVNLTKMCMLEDGKLRPNMRQVVGILNSNQPGTKLEEASEWTEEALSREAFHKKTRPMFMDLGQSHSQIESPNWSTPHDILSFTGPQPRS